MKEEKSQMFNGYLTDPFIYSSGHTTKTFSEVFDSQQNFLDEYADSGFDAMGNGLKEESLKTLFLLLFARYGNSHIANLDENQFKYKVFSTIFMYGPTWEKRVEIQSKIRNLSLEELRKGSVQINSHVYNDGSEGTTDQFEFLNKINEQSGNAFKKNELDAYNSLSLLLETDVTRGFLDRFKPFFGFVTTSTYPLYYETEVEQDEQV